MGLLQCTAKPQAVSGNHEYCGQTSSVLVLGLLPGLNVALVLGCIQQRQP